MQILRRLVDVNRSLSGWIARRFPKTFAHPDPGYKAVVLQRFADAVASCPVELVAEIGGVDRPLLSRSDGYVLVGVDIEERPDCNRLYDRFIVQSIEEPLPIEADVIVSVTLLEHVPDNSAAISSIFKALSHGGSTHHYVPSAFHPYSIALRLIGSSLQKKLIPLLRPGAETVTGYPAFFDLCTPGAMTRKFRETGFIEIDVKPYFRANDYFAFFTPLFIVVTLFENLCALFNLRLFASGFVISAKKPQ